MPGILHNPIGRRAFLKSTAMASAGIALFSKRASGADENEAEPLHLALLSDTHLPADPKNEYRGFRPYDNLTGIIPEVVATKPEAVIINGDAARLTGELADYRQLRDVLNPLAEITPIYIGLGNHDHRENFFNVIDERPGNSPSVKNKHVVVMDHPHVRLVVLDSLLYVDKVAGLLGKAQREWLTGYLATDDKRPVVLFIHHTLGDGDGDLLDADRLFRIITPAGKVKAIFYGHSHVYGYSVRENVQLINLPAVGYNFSDAQPVGWVDSKFRPDGADLTLRAFGGNTTGNGKTTRLKWL
jgi:3',5'-cyclic AMP phosphodiesterase CpdA